MSKEMLVTASQRFRAVFRIRASMAVKKFTTFGHHDPFALRLPVEPEV